MRKYTKTAFLAAGGLCILAALLSLTLGVSDVTAADIWGVLCGDRESAAARILLYLRLPRTLAALMAGAGLAGAGVIIQTLLHNPLAGPSVIGVNAGAGLAVVICAAVIPGVWGIPIAAFLGALTAMLFIYMIAGRTSSRATLILAGVAVNSVLTAATTAVRVLVPDALQQSFSFSVGGFANLSARTLYPACILIGCAILPALCGTRTLDILALGNDGARNLGVPVRTARLCYLILAAVLAGASVSFAGLLGFVGLIVPHLARIFTGEGTKKLLPLAMLFGAGGLTLCDVLTRVAFAPYELPVGIVMAFLGAPFFLWLLLWERKRAARGKRGGEAAHSPAPSDILTLSGIRVRYGTRTVLDVTLGISRGKLTVIAGPNGSGKSTLLRVCAGLLQPSRGQMLLGGREITDIGFREYAKRVAYLPQTAQVPDVRVREYVRMGRFPHARRGYGAEDERRVTDAMREAGCAELCERYCGELSGGELQRVRLAQVLARDEEVLLLDEPTAALDPAHQLEILALAKQLTARGVTVVMVLHELAHAMTCADELVLLHDGCVAAQGLVSELMQTNVVEEVFGVTVTRMGEGYLVKELNHVGND